jgi:hypothetical protein
MKGIRRKKKYLLLCRPGRKWNADGERCLVVVQTISCRLLIGNVVEMVVEGTCSV